MKSAGKWRSKRSPVLERIMPLRVGHRPGVEPHVDHRGGPAHGPAAFRAAFATGPGHLVDEGPVRVEVLAQRAGALLQLGQAADPLRDVVVAVADPDRERGAPVAVARQRPVDVAGQPFSHAPVADLRRVPGRVPVDGEHLVLERRGGGEPGFARDVEQRGLTAPAVRVRVRHPAGPEEVAPAVELLQKQGIGVLDEHPPHQREPLVEAPRVVDGAHEREAVAPAGGVVVRAEGGRDVHDAGAVLRRDEVLEDDAPRGIGAVGDRHHLQRPRVTDPLERTGVVLAHDAGALAEHALDQVLRHDHAPAFRLRLGVGEGGIERQRRVGGHRPGGGGPSQEGASFRVRLPALGEERSEEEERRILDLAIAQRHLVRAEGGAAAGAVGHALVAAVEKPLLRQLAQDPPDRLDVAGVAGDVGPLVVEPIGDALGQRLPVRLVGEDGIAAGAVEAFDAHRFDLGLPRDAERLLGLDLDREPVRVPPGDARDPASLERLVAAGEVLQRASQDVVQAGACVRGGRSLVEDEGLAALGCLHAAAEEVFLAPALESLLLQFEQGGGQVRVAHGGRSTPARRRPRGPPR